MTTYEVRKREIACAVTEFAEPEPVEGFTTGLQTARVVPDEVIFTEYTRTGSVHAVVSGLVVGKNGVTKRYGVVKVMVTQLDGGNLFYPPAPGWITEMWEEVR